MRRYVVCLFRVTLDSLSPDRLEGAIRAAMAEAEPARARELLERLSQLERTCGVEEAADPSSLWDPFVRLLHRRGYYVSSPHAVRLTLDEIREMGPGFDLYDLAVALAHWDAGHARGRGVPSGLLPELDGFRGTKAMGGDSVQSSEASNP